METSKSANDIGRGMGTSALRRSSLLFFAVGLAIYGAVYVACERLLYRTGKSNPVYKIETAEPVTYDWVILGASHAMTLDFAEFNAWMERESGLRILNLASPGTGPLYNRFVFEDFLRRHDSRGLLYVVDSFGFYAPAWNEERFSDAKLLRRTPFSPDVARSLVGYVIAEGIDPRAALDYVTGFSKINNRERFDPDIWEGEAQFERVHRPSATADRRRIDYLYPQGRGEPAMRERYSEEFEAILDLAESRGIEAVVIKMPVPARFHALLPEEAVFDAAMSELLSARQVPYRDFSLAMDESRFYFDTDHLNRTGLTEFFERHLGTTLKTGRGG